MWVAAPNHPVRRMSMLWWTRAVTWPAAVRSPGQPVISAWRKPCRVEPGSQVGGPRRGGSGCRRTSPHAGASGRLAVLEDFGVPQG